MDELNQKRDLVLPPGSYIFMQDTSKGTIKTYVGPTVVNPTAQEVAVKYEKGQFLRVGRLEDAVRTAPVAVEGYYINLLNPAKGNKHPEDGTSQQSADLDVGRKVVIPGPAMFALWPGQSAEVVRGHHLRSNQYLLVRVYNEEEARANWTNAIIKPAETKLGADGKPEQAAPVATASAPQELTVGKKFIIRGTEVSFYIPPTGVTVEHDTVGNYVREALTLERLEYCILVDENGTKRYERGPKVVFPEPTERFIEQKDDDGSMRKKFRAIELNNIQGIHIKVIADYVEEDGTERAAGEELFITGADTAIYFPREEHSAVKYDGKAKHFATAIPAGEARYVMNRNTGEIRTVKGPAMLLPDPRSEVIVRRVLSDRQSTLWYPGNEEALKYNQSLRSLLANAPTTRAGAVSEGEVARAALSRGGTVGSSGTLGGAPMYKASNAMMESSSVGREQNVVGEEFSRGSTYTQPRTVTLDTKYQGAPALDIWTGYAVQVVSKTGKRRVEVGPTTILMEYDEALEILELSTGRPKTTDNLLRTVYLRTENNKVSDTIRVETADHVTAEVYVSYRVNFEGDSSKWFRVENYVKFLCDHARSVLKGAVKKIPVETFYADSTDIIRNTLLGEPKDGKRTGMVFAENGMHVIDVEVLNVKLSDERIRDLLDKAQHEVVRTNIDLSMARRDLEVTTEKQSIARKMAEEVAETRKTNLNLEADIAAEELSTLLQKLANEFRASEERIKRLDMEQKAELVRNKEDETQRLFFEKQEQELRLAAMHAEAEAIAKRFSAATGSFSEALVALSNNEVLAKVAEALNMTRAIGGDSFAEALGKVFNDTPLGPVVAKITRPNGKDTRSTPPA